MRGEIEVRGGGALSNLGMGLSAVKKEYDEEMDIRHF